MKELEKLPKTRKEAKYLGSTSYFTGNPCKHGHVSPKLTSSYQCIECRTIARNSEEGKKYHKQYIKQWNQLNIEKNVQYKKNWRDRHPDQSKKYYKENKEECKQYSRRYYIDNKEHCLLKMKEHALNNPEIYKNRRRERYIKQHEKYLRQSRDWKLNNMNKVSAHNAKRRAHKLNATPNWLTLEDLERIENIYEQAQQLTKETGIPHGVDHYYPLQGETVSGLHVPSNLQVITNTENCKKNNKHPDDHYETSHTF